jgi:hypothetical protein
MVREAVNDTLHGARYRLSSPRATSDRRDAPPSQMVGFVEAWCDRTVPSGPVGGAARVAVLGRLGCMSSIVYSRQMWVVAVIPVGASCRRRTLHCRCVFRPLALSGCVGSAASLGSSSALRYGDVSVHRCRGFGAAVGARRRLDAGGAGVTRRRARSAIEAHGGWLFKHTGDGVCAAFSSAVAAIGAAIGAAPAAASGEDGPR